MRDQGLEQAFDASVGGSTLAPAAVAARPSFIASADIDGIAAAAAASLLHTAHPISNVRPRAACAAACSIGIEGDAFALPA
jgi:hypothetical protein